MAVIFIAVLLVMLALNIFMFFVIKRTAIRVDKQVKSYFMKQLEICDTIYEEKAAVREDKASVFGQDAQALPDRSYEGDGESCIPAAAFMEGIEVRSAAYQNENFLNEYKTVKEKMKIDKSRTLMAIIREEALEKETEVGGVITGLLHSFNFDTVYNISTLSPPKQEALLREVFDESQTLLLDAYLDETESFDVLKFFDFLKELSFSVGSDFYVKTGDFRENFDGLAENVVTVYDPSIVEGMKIVYRNRMYDYSM